MGSSSSRRARIERGIYMQPNGKYAVCWRHAGRLRFRTVGFDLAAARRERRALLAATGAGTVPVSPRLRFETVVGWWLERFDAKVRADGATPAHAGGASLPPRAPPAPRLRGPAGRLDHRRRRRRTPARAALQGMLAQDVGKRAGDARERHALRPSPRLDNRGPRYTARTRRAAAADTPPSAGARARRDRAAALGLLTTRPADDRDHPLQRPPNLRDARPDLG